jgi:soluble lytic murein transglycosylase-like protein
MASATTAAGRRGVAVRRRTDSADLPMENLLRLRRVARRQFRHHPAQYRGLPQRDRAAAAQFGVEEAIVRAIIHAESA